MVVIDSVNCPGAHGLLDVNVKNLLCQPIRALWDPRTEPYTLLEVYVNMCYGRLLTQYKGVQRIQYPPMVTYDRRRR